MVQDNDNSGSRLLRVIGAGANYGLTRYVGHQAKQWFIIDSSMEPAKHIP